MMLGMAMTYTQHQQLSLSTPLLIVHQIQYLDRRKNVYKIFAATQYHPIPNTELIVKMNQTKMVVTECNVFHAIQVHI